MVQGHPAPTSYYAEIARILKSGHMPTFVVPGDNEFNDLPNPERGWQNWMQFFLHYSDRKSVV